MARAFGRLSLTLVLLAGSCALAADAADWAGRYAVSPKGPGFIRLDTASGKTSHCAYENGALVCERLSSTDAAAAARLDKLAGEVAELRAALDKLSRRVSRLAVGAPPLAVQPAPAPPAFAASIVDRFLEMVRRLKHGGGERAA